MAIDIDESRLDDAAALTGLDPDGMLLAAATGAAQLRESWLSSVGPMAEVAAEGRPRSIVICAMGGSAMGADLMIGLVGSAAPMPIIVNRSERLPGWVGAADIVIGVSCSGQTAETLSAMSDASRRSARLVGIGGEDSPLADLVVSGRGTFVPVRKVLAPRATMWGLCAPLLALASSLGMCDFGEPDGELPADLEAAAARLEQVAVSCRPGSDSFLNPAKELAIALAGSLPMVWGSGRTTAPVALRFVCQLAENAKLAAISGALPEALHNQVVCFDGSEPGSAGDDLFRDRVEETDGSSLHVVLLRDDETDIGDAADRVMAAERGRDVIAVRRLDAAEFLAQERGLKTTVLRGQGASPVERLASLVGLTDFASIYLGLLRGLDPTPISSIDALKAAMR